MRHTHDIPTPPEGWITTVIATYAGVLKPFQTLELSTGLHVEAELQGTARSVGLPAENADLRRSLSGLVRKFVGGWSGIVEVEAGGAVESFFGVPAVCPVGRIWSW